MGSSSVPDEVREVRSLAERVRASWSGEPRSLSLIKPYDFHKERRASYDEWAAFEMGWGVWWCLPVFGFSAGPICLALDHATPAPDAAVIRECEGQGNVQGSHIRHYLKRSYLDDHLFPLYPETWERTRADWQSRKATLVTIHQALGNTDALEDFEALLFDEALFPRKIANKMQQIGRVLGRVDPSPHLARVATIAQAVDEGGETDLDAEVGPWSPMVSSLTRKQQVYSFQQAHHIALRHAGNVDISGEAIEMIRFPNRNNALFAHGAIGGALQRGAKEGFFTVEQQKHPLFRAYLGEIEFSTAAARLASAGEHQLAWNALLTANLYAPLDQKKRAWLPLFKRALSVARAANFRFVPVLEWMWSNYVRFNPDVSRSGV